MSYIVIDSPVGKLTLAESGGALTHLLFGDIPMEGANAETPLLAEARGQLAAYFAGERREFDLPLAPEGTEFQKLAWQGLLAIPYGHTSGYGELARAVGRPNASRAIGGANHKNPISIIVPCHRVVGSDGGLTGYGGGLDKKAFLLALEKRNLNAE